MLFLLNQCPASHTTCVPGNYTGSLKTAHLRRASQILCTAFRAIPSHFAKQLDQYNTKIVRIQQLSNDQCHWLVSGFRWHSEQMYGFRSNIWLDIITNVICMLIRILWQPRSQCTIISFFMIPSLPRHTKCKCPNHTERHMKLKPKENFRCLHTWRLFTQQEQFSVTQPNHVRPRRRRRMLCSLSLFLYGRSWKPRNYVRLNDHTSPVKWLRKTSRHSTSAVGLDISEH